MKKNCLLVLLSFFAINMLNVQGQHRWCASSEAHQQRLQNDAEYALFIDEANSMEKVQNASIPCDGTNTVVVPLAFHFDSAFTCADVSCLLSKVQAQIDVLNIAYGDQTTHPQNIALEAACAAGYPLSDVSDGACIEFRLGVAPAGAGLDPSCDPAITVGQFEGGTQTDHNGAGAVWAGYLNVFVAETVDVSIFGIPIPGIIGISDGLPGLANGDGVTVLASAFGGPGGVGCNSGAALNSGLDLGSGQISFTEGGTLAHEVGHYLGLFHTWGDDDLFGTPPFCGTLDNGNSGPFTVEDTPDQGAASDPSQACPTLVGATCTSLPNTCGSNDYFHNYMDYSNDICQSMFTNDQALVTNYWANQLFGGSTIQTLASVPATLTTECAQSCPTAVCEITDIQATQNCNADGSYSVEIVVTGVDASVSLDDANSTEGSQAANGTVTFTYAAGTDANITVVDTEGLCTFGPFTYLASDCVVCEDEITYEVTASTCDMTGATIELQDETGNTVMSMALGNEGGSGSFGVQACGNYQIVILNAPACYTDTSGDIGPRLFSVDGTGTEFLAFQSFVETIPTLSEWGLITLALMLMTYGTLAVAGVGAFAGTSNVNTPIGFQLPVNAAILRKAFVLTTVLAAIGYGCSIVLFGAIFFSDIVGVAIAGSVFAYLLHLLILVEKNK